MSMQWLLELELNRAERHSQEPGLKWLIDIMSDEIDAIYFIGYQLVYIVTNASYFLKWIRM